jgi:predicted  nucleic acid-binding Zn-ribbon protein
MHNGRAKPLVFDEEFHKRPVKDQLNYLKDLCSSQNHALDLMQKERNALRDQNNLLLEQASNAETAFYTQKEIVKNLINQSNEDAQGIAQRIHELEARVKAQDAVIEGFNGNLN